MIHANSAKIQTDNAANPRKPVSEPNTPSPKSAAGGYQAVIEPAADMVIPSTRSSVIDGSSAGMNDTSMIAKIKISVITDDAAFLCSIREASAAMTAPTAEDTAIGIIGIKRIPNTNRIQ